MPFSSLPWFSFHIMKVETNTAHSFLMKKRNSTRIESVNINILDKTQNLHRVRELDCVNDYYQVDTIILSYTKSAFWIHVLQNVPGHCNQVQFFTFDLNLCKVVHICIASGNNNHIWGDRFLDHTRVASCRKLLKAS